MQRLRLNPDVTRIGRNSRGSESGFTLVEALVAIVILAVGLIAVTNLLVVAATSNTTANHSTAATAIASRVLDTLKALPYDDPGLATGGDLANDAQNIQGLDSFRDDDVRGVGQIHTRWQVQAAGARILFIQVRSEGRAPLVAGRSRAEFATFRGCAAQAAGCP